MEKQERHREYQRARSWLARPTRVITAKFSEDGKNEWRKVEVLRTVTENMRTWISQDRIEAEIAALAKRNGWI